MGVPAATYGGRFLHTDVHEMAAAYLFHIARDHPFVDGNERTALMAAVVFLGLNGYGLEADPDELFRQVVGAAEGVTSKSALATFFREFARKRPG